MMAPLYPIAPPLTIPSIDGIVTADPQTLVLPTFQPIGQNQRCPYKTLKPALYIRSRRSRHMCALYQIVVVTLVTLNNNNNNNR